VNGGDTGGGRDARGTLGMLNRESETEDRKCLLWLLVLAGGFFLLRCPVIGEYFDYHFDEHFYTNGALEMLKGGDYLTPHTADGELRFNKPPLTYWLVILGFKLFGVSPFSARLPFLLIGCVLIGLTYRLASILLGQAGTDSQFPNSRKLVSVPAKPAAVLAAAILASNATFLYHAGYSIADGLVSLGVLVAHYGFMRVLVLRDYKRRNLFYGYLGTGLAVATKGLPGVLPVIFAWLYALCAWWYERRLAGHRSCQAGTDSQFPNSRKLVSVPALLDGPAIFLGLLLCAWWPLTEAFIHGRGFWNDFLYEQASRRFERGHFVYGLVRNIGINIFYYPAVLLKAFLPWGLVFLALAVRFRSALWGHLWKSGDTIPISKQPEIGSCPRMWLYIAAACLMECIFYLPANIHRSRYLMPVFPLMAVFMAGSFQALTSAVNIGRLLRWLFLTLAALGLLLGIGLLCLQGSEGIRARLCGAFLAIGSAATMRAMRWGTRPAQAAMAGVFLILAYSVFDWVGGPEFSRSPYIQVLAQLKAHGIEQGRVGIGPRVMQELPAQLRVISGGRLEFVRVDPEADTGLEAIIVREDLPPNAGDRQPISKLPETFPRVSPPQPSRHGYQAVEAGYGFMSKGKSFLPGRNNDRVEWALSALRGKEEGFRAASRTRYWLLLKTTAGPVLGSRPSAGKDAGGRPAKE